MLKTCAFCAKSYNRPPSLAGSFCSKACAYAARRKDVTDHRRMRYLPNHPLAGKTGLVSEARTVLYTRIGGGVHQCHWCGCAIRWVTGRCGYTAGAIVADHVDNDPINDAQENIVASCGPCNGARTRKISKDELFVERSNGTRLRAVERTCAKCDKPFLIPPAFLRKPNGGLYCSLSCARKGPRKTKGDKLLAC